MNNQSKFLQNIRQALGKTERQHSLGGLPQSEYSSMNRETLRETIRSRSDEELNSLVSIFIENAKPLNLKTHTADSVEAAADIIDQIVQATEPEFQTEKHIVVHDHPVLSALQLWKKLATRQVGVHTTFVDDSSIKEKTIASYVGITAADLAIADGAAILQLTKNGRPRTTSLIPSIHIAVLDKKQLVANINEAYALLEVEKELPDSFVFISGPSKTADIEAHLVHGAHGPREMHVIIIC